MRRVRWLTLIAFACGLGTPARAELLVHKDLSAAMALTMVETAIATCTANGNRVSVTVVGRNGEPIVQVRGDRTGPHTFENSFRKAYTSRTFNVSSGEIAKRLKENPQLFMVYLNNVIPAQGGLPIRTGDDVIGAIGVSGSPGGDKDEVCAQAAIDKVAPDLK